MIEKRLEQSKELIFVTSENSLNSIWCKYELNYFNDLGRKIYFVDKIDIDSNSILLKPINDLWFLDKDYKKLALIEGDSIKE